MGVLVRYITGFYTGLCNLIVIYDLTKSLMMVLINKTMVIMWRDLTMVPCDPQETTSRSLLL